jgi:hypothetical protein
VDVIMGRVCCFVAYRFMSNRQLVVPVEHPDFSAEISVRADSERPLSSLMVTMSFHGIGS